MRKINIALPGSGKSVREFAIEVGSAMRKICDSGKQLYCVRFGIVGVIVTSDQFASTIRFKVLSPLTLVSEIEDYITFTGNHGVTKSMSTAQANLLLASPQLKAELHQVDKILRHSIPANYQVTQTASGARTVNINMIKKGFSREPDGTGKIINYYCAEAQTDFVTFSKDDRLEKLNMLDKQKKEDELKNTDSEIEKNDIEIRYKDRLNKRLAAFDKKKDAIAILLDVFSDFNFYDGTSQSLAVARLLTSYCQAMIGWKKRTPCWLFTASSPRAGKDYLAKIAPILFEGFGSEDAPLDDNDGEIKRRITATVMGGSRFMHFANCRGSLNSPSLEAAITCEFWSDRVVGTSESITMAMETIFSLSYNDSDVKNISKDLLLRSRMIKLVTPIDLPGSLNKQKFSHEDLHGELLQEDRRQLIFAALHAMVREWAENGAPPGQHFTSFPEWAKVVSGILEVAKFRDITLNQGNENSGLNLYPKISEEITKLFEAISTQHPDKGFTFDDVIEFIEANPVDYPILSVTESNQYQQAVGRYMKQLVAESDPWVPDSIMAERLNRDERRKIYRFWRAPGPLKVQFIDL